jgi:hypothetical protein
VGEVQRFEFSWCWICWDGEENMSKRITWCLCGLGMKVWKEKGEIVKMKTKKKERRKNECSVV